MKPNPPSLAPHEAQLTPLAARRLAAAIRHCGDEAAFASHVREILRLVPLLQRSTVEFGAPAGPAPAFSESTYAVPLRGSGGVCGVVRHPLEGAPLGGEEIGTLHAAAELLGAITDLAVRMRDGRKVIALLQFVADQMPVGVICLGQRPAVLACNRMAAFFCDGDPARQPERLWSLLEGAAGGGGPVRCLKRGDRLGLLDVRLASGPEAPAGSGVVLILDCTEAARTFRDALARETYRSLLEKQPLTLAVAACAGGVEPLVVAAAGLGAHLPPGASCGMLDEQHFGVLLPQLDKVAATAVLRVLDPFRGLEGLRVGLAALPGRFRSPDELVEAARAHLVPWETAARPQLFVFDRAAAVTETLAFVLRGACGVTCANRSDDAHRILGERAFDGLILEIAAPVEAPGTEFVCQAVALQPRARPFFVTGLPRPWPLQEWGLPQADVFRKPFAVQEIRSAVRTALGVRG